MIKCLVDEGLSKSMNYLNDCNFFNLLSLFLQVSQFPLYYNMEITCVITAVYVLVWLWLLLSHIFRSIISGISPSSSKERVRDAHKKIMLLNHPDRGGSPYLAAKINEAKEYLDHGGRT